MVTQGPGMQVWVKAMSEKQVRGFKHKRKVQFIDFNDLSSHGAKA